MKEYERVAITKDRIREAMRDAGLRQVDLVRETGLNRGTVSRYLSGEVEPRQDAAHKLAVVLGVSELWLWGYPVPKGRTAEQKKNDDLAKVIGQMRTNSDFFDLVLSLSKLPQEEYDSVKRIVSAFAKQ